MTLMAEPTPVSRPLGASAPMSTGHPALGRAPEATIIPLGLDCYQIVLDGTVRGYVCSTDDGWECFAGAHLGEARPVGSRRSITGAIRDLCRDPATP